MNRRTLIASLAAIPFFATPARATEAVENTSAGEGTYVFTRYDKELLVFSTTRYKARVGVSLRDHLRSDLALYEKGNPSGILLLHPDLYEPLGLMMGSWESTQLPLQRTKILETQHTRLIVIPAREDFLWSIDRDWIRVK